ncbi:hypothetical protein DRH14_01610 [Candidatus Shapirobacteria bacterium]|nr:MAG: hypothetical protein DRH14_01610 [Candidatus Shapirobacteria bacterium]
MKTALLYHPELKAYNFEEGHPFSKDRFTLFLNFFRQRIKGFAQRFEIIEPELPSDEIIELVHSREYIKIIKSASEGMVFPHILTYVSSDNLSHLSGYIPKGIEKGARAIVGCSLAAGEVVAQGRFSKAIGVGGGLHHARPSYGEGFCFYNDVAICVKNLKQRYNLSRILVLDTDAHAGNGTKEIFYKDPDVLFIDIHQDPHTLYPGTGFIYELGEGEGEGFTVNLPLPVGASNDAYSYVFEEIILPLSKEFRPEIIIRYGGSDPHYKDELTNLGLTLKGFKMIGRYVREMAEELCGGKSVELLASGYNLNTLPFLWSALLSGSLNINIDLSDMKEESPPPANFRLEQTKEMIRAIKKMLRKYWRTMDCLHP